MNIITILQLKDKERDLQRGPKLSTSHKIIYIIIIMAQEGTSSADQQPSTVLAYPLPPLQYINNIDNFSTPPAPITEGVYHNFGQRISVDDNIIAPLEAHGTKRVYPKSDYDYKKELKKINLSILVNFLDLVDVLVKCPDTDKRIEKCNDLATLFINFHHLINELRPHQARETLRVWLHAQRRTREEIAKKLNAEMDKITKVLDKYTEYEAANKITKQQQAEGTIEGDKVNNNTTTTTTTNISVDDIMCKIVDESCSWSRLSKLALFKQSLFEQRNFASFITQEGSLYLNILSVSLSINSVPQVK